MDDLISRGELLKQFPVNMENPLWHFTGIRAAIEAAPAVDAVPVVHEQWIDKCRGKVCVCSRCDQEFDHTYDAIKDEWLFCPKCGARMDGEA